MVLFFRFIIFQFCWMTGFQAFLPHQKEQTAFFTEKAKNLSDPESGA